MHFTSVGYSEIDANAAKTYCSNFNPTPDEVVMGDIVEFTSKVENIENLPHFELLTGGFPCQTFSMMGKQAGFNEDRGQMFFRIMDIVKIKRPRYVLLENVKNLFTHDKGNTFARIRKELEHEGYNVMADIFNTADYHLPQKRNRVLIFATREKLPKGFEFTPEAVKKCFDEHIEKSSLLHYKSVVELLAKEVESKYYLSEKIKPTILSDGSAGFKSRSDINQSIARPLTASMHKMHRACQDNYYSQDYIDTNGEVNPVETMTKEELAKLKIRKLTPAEAFMLQGFPSEFAIKASFSKVSDGALYKQAGNAVSVNTIYAVVYYLIKSKIIK
jgi:DNA (cytosine-5)-methyltransferase 1